MLLRALLFVAAIDDLLCADYTLDYNYEAAYYGVYASGHPELAALYFQPMIDGMAAATRGAQVRATMGNLTCMKPTALHYNAHISPWGYGDMDEGWETKTGQEMVISLK